jgi:hypothetical protein
MKELVPELHDVLKLIAFHGRDAHDVSQWGEQEREAYKDVLPTNTETWKGITQHHLGFGIYPTEPDTFYLCVADSLASSVSRVGKGGSLEYRLNKLWKGPEEGKDVRLRETEDVIHLFKFLQNEPSWEEFLKEYESLLRTRPEDYRRGLNITSLYAHCKLTGQFFRILKSSPLFPLTPTEFEGKTQDGIKELYRNKVNREWKLGVSRCKFHFLQKPFRVRDLNIFSALDELLKEISNIYSDNVVLATSNELLIVYSDEAQLSHIAQVANQKGFWVEVVRAQRPLGAVKPNPESMQGKELTNLYNLLPEIPPPICEICQSAEATRHWPEDYVLSHLEICPTCRQLLSENSLASVIDLICEADKVKLEEIITEPAREELCERCYTLRADGTKLLKLDKWSKEEQNKVAWIKLNLDFSKLEKTLESLSGSEVSFAVIAEFQEDYAPFLREFASRIYKIFGAEDVESIMTDFFCVRVGTFGRAFKVLDIYYRLMKDFFPAFLNLQDSPVKLAMVCVGVKFPFFEVYRILEEAKEDVFVSLQGVRTMRAPIAALELLVKAASLRYPKSALHKLMKIEQTSEKLAELTFQDRRDRDRATYSKLAITLRPKLDFSSIFTLTLLMED